MEPARLGPTQAARLFTLPSGAIVASSTTMPSVPAGARRLWIDGIDLGHDSLVHGFERNSARLDSAACACVSNSFQDLCHCHHPRPASARVEMSSAYNPRRPMRTLRLRGDRFQGDDGRRLGVAAPACSSFVTAVFFSEIFPESAGLVAERVNPIADHFALIRRQPHKLERRNAAANDNAQWHERERARRHSASVVQRPPVVPRRTLRPQPRPSQLH